MSISTPTRPTLNDWLALVRLPNLFTAAADVAMGLLIAEADVRFQPGVMVLLIAASLLFYASGVVLNDVADFEHDKIHRPARPLPSGAIPLSLARTVGAAMLLGGLAAAGSCAVWTGRWAPAAVAGALAMLILLYDFVLKATPLGPAVMGGCRGLNTLLGLSIAANFWLPEYWLIAGAFSVYTAGVTVFARTEESQSRSAALITGIILMLAGVAILAPLPWVAHTQPSLQLLWDEPQRWYVLIGLLAVVTVLRNGLAVSQPTAENVQRAVGQSILLLIFMDTAATFALRGLTEALYVIVLLLPTMYAGRMAKMT